ncbi:g6497 [Coccomyxa viridis]|uniref:G6497 protein n=1 Tax=Coccomyxa viridis TaxID=1274662 RepID=A0ABP1FWR8_9CHLO
MRSSRDMRHVKASILLFSTACITAVIGHKDGTDNTSAAQDCAAYLRRTMPQEDLKSLSEEYISQNIDLTLKARHSLPWAADVPWQVFLQYVLPYAIVDERRDNWRPLFQEHFSPLISDAAAISEAALTLNREIWQFWNITFKANQTPNIMSPFQVIDAGYASCTGLSIFLVNALRAVGIPARMAGTPQWNTEAGGNHDWVEIWDGGVWSFTGPTEYSDKGLNSTWFVPEPAKRAEEGSRMHAIYAVSWERRKGTVQYPLTWTENKTVAAHDVSRYYIAASEQAKQNVAVARAL